MVASADMIFHVLTLEIKLLYSLNHHKEDKHAAAFRTSIH